MYKAALGAADKNRELTNPNYVMQMPDNPRLIQPKPLHGVLPIEIRSSTHCWLNAELHYGGTFPAMNPAFAFFSVFTKLLFPPLHNCPIWQKFLALLSLLQFRGSELCEKQNNLIGGSLTQDCIAEPLGHLWPGKPGYWSWPG